MRSPALVSFGLALCACGAPDGEPPTEQPTQQPPRIVDADACEAPQPWEGPVQDIDLDDPTAWQLTGGNFDGASRVAFNDGAVCGQQALLSQSIDMPERCVVGGAAVEVSYGVQGGLASMSYQGALVRLGDRVLDVGAEATPARLCLGERSFGRSLDVAFAPSARDACEEEAPLGLSVDRLAIVQDESCPAPGAVHPFDVWRTYGNESGSAVARVEGEAIHLGTRGCGDTVYAEGPQSGALSVPDRKGLALKMRLNGNLDGAAENGLQPALLRMNEMFAADLPLGDDVHICLPDAVRGTVVRLKVRLMSTACEDQDLFIDGIEVVEDASCGEGLVFDGGFNGAFARGFDASLNWRRTGDVRIEPDEAGNPAAVLRGPAALLRTIVTVPPATPAGGPALRAHVTTPGETASPIDPQAMFIRLPLLPEIAAAQGDSEMLLCLPATRAGQALDVDFQLTTREARLDDVTVGNDARCPGAPDVSPLGSKG